jgi:hypothetical protein
MKRDAGTGCRISDISLGPLDFSQGDTEPHDDVHVQFVLQFDSGRNLLFEQLNPLW